MDTASSDPTAPRAFTGRLLILILFARTVLNTAVRAVYPFLPFIAADLNVSFQSAASIIQARDLIGITAPLFGPLSDRYGRRAIMLGGMGITTLASLSLLFISPLAAIVVAMAFISLGVILFVPAQQAFLGDRVPYAQRGRVIAAAELAWSFAAIIGLPLVGIMIHNVGWRWAFAAIGVFGIVAFVLLGVMLPRDRGAQHKHTAQLHGAVLEALRQPVALAAISTTFLLAMANENLGVIYGEWMKNTFALDPVALGLVGAAIGGAEFAAEMFAVLFLDRIGKWRTVAGAGLCGAGAYFLFPFMGANALLGTAGLVIVFFTFELAIISVIPLISEISPHARGSLLSMSIASTSVGRAIGSFSGPVLLTGFSFGTASIVSGVIGLLAFLTWTFLVRERHGEQSAAQL